MQLVVFDRFGAKDLLHQLPQGVEAAEVPAPQMPQRSQQRDAMLATHAKLVFTKEQQADVPAVLSALSALKLVLDPAAGEQTVAGAAERAELCDSDTLFFVLQLQAPAPAAEEVAEPEVEAPPPATRVELCEPEHVGTEGRESQIDMHDWVEAYFDEKISVTYRLMLLPKCIWLWFGDMPAFGNLSCHVQVGSSPDACTTVMTDQEEFSLGLGRRLARRVGGKLVQVSCQVTESHLADPGLQMEIERSVVKKLRSLAVLSVPQP
eukprot:TRINITY_DN35657_c0_g1_i1.p1 TRINITY_DN35657_c0_g1~~TRINITY_DN35657_c0_g1_i1.p1  ORF type:complete len:264 (+),score=52.85 TRINITY_DN35657_c0_g1_i1:71-862(+)